ncbi:cell surface glycoprotein 1 [Melanotaenia boesemani]|uniref:cell surface glycoprotein 1 n=1 Tax=Melanotaenia boesemani TaxID=1250792 RepID=UPI001C05B733|nr:cell surface glycoprotein 1 [Melanotaenia boesemani]
MRQHHPWSRSPTSPTRRRCSSNLWERRVKESHSQTRPRKPRLPRPATRLQETPKPRLPTRPRPRQNPPPLAHPGPHPVRGQIHRRPASQMVSLRLTAWLKRLPLLQKRRAPRPQLPPKKPAGTVGASASKSTNKVGEKKATGMSPATNGAKAAPAAKKTPSMTANGVKSSTSAAAAKKPTASKTPSTTSTKPSSVSSPKLEKPPVSKTTRPSSSTPRPATGSSQSAGLTKSSTATSKPATPKTASTAAKPATPKSTSTTPSGGKPPVSQTSRTTTPVKKDVSKPATPAAKKLTDSPLTRPSSTTKSAAKPETPKSASKSDVATKKPSASKTAETKTPNRSKTQESKPTPHKTPNTKTAPTKTSSPKKTVGSSTPTPVKRGPKAAAVAEPAKEIAAAVAAAAAIATAATVIAGPEESQPPAEVAVEPSAADKTPKPTPELVPVAVLEPVQESTLEPVQEPKLEPVREQTPEPIREPTPEPVWEPTPEPIREPTPEPVWKSTPEPIREPTPETVWEPTPEPVREPSPEFPAERSHPSAGVELGAAFVHEPASSVQISAQMDPFKFQVSDQSVPCLGTTVMSPPSSPPGPASPIREPQNTSSLLDMDVQSDAWDQNQAPATHSPVNMNFQTEEEKENNKGYEPQEMPEEEEEEQEDEDKENLLMPTSTVPEAFSAPAQPHFLGASPLGDFTSGELISPHEKEVAVEKADEEINEDIDEEDDDDDEEQRRLGQQLSSMATDISTSQPSDEFQVRSSAFGGSAGWHGDDLLSGMDSEDVSSCTSSRQPGVSDLSSTLHTAILEGTQSSDALVDSSLRGSEGDCNLMGSPNVETLANEEEEDENEEDERVDDIDMSSEKAEEHQRGFQEEEDEDVEMHSEGVMEGFGNDEDDLNKEECLDNFSHSGPPPCAPTAPFWGQTNPFADTWAQPSSLLSVSSPSPLSDHGAAESETPTQSPAQAYLDNSAPSFAPLEPQHHHSSEMKDSAPEEVHDLLNAPAVAMSQSSTLSGTALAAHSSSETSTPEELQDYDSSSGVESRSDKQHTPVPTAVQPDMEQDLGIHLEKGDGEEEEAETLPADEVLGTGPPTAPASAPSSSSTSGDEASDTEGEMQINDPEAPVEMDDERVGFESPPPSCSLPALEEDEEAVDTAAGEGEEDGGGATPQSANSVASYGFDCTTSNSNAHSMAESCGKSPGIFSLENEEQLPEEAKDPSLIKELTLPSAAAAQAEDLLGSPVDLMPLGHAEDNFPSLDDHHYLFGGKMAAEHLEEGDPLEPSQHLGVQESGDPGDSQPPYYSTICDKTDSFLEGNV